MDRETEVVENGTQNSRKCHISGGRRLHGSFFHQTTPSPGCCCCCSEDGVAEDELEESKLVPLLLLLPEKRNE
jgi:hypothetical protein